MELCKEFSKFEEWSWNWPRYCWIMIGDNKGNHESVVHVYCKILFIPHLVPKCSWSIKFVFIRIQIYTVLQMLQNVYQYTITTYIKCITIALRLQIIKQMILFNPCVQRSNTHAVFRYIAIRQGTDITIYLYF